MKKSIAQFSLLSLLAACGGTPQGAPHSGFTSIPLQNPSFNAEADGKMPGWIMTEHGAGNSYTFVADPVNAKSAPTSARMKRHGIEPYAFLEQAVLILPAWHNKTLRLSGAMKSEKIDGGGGALMMRADGGSGEILAWNFMADARVKGTQDWKSYSIDLKIPPTGRLLRVGVMLEDGGTLWADDLLLELID